MSAKQPISRLLAAEKKRTSSLHLIYPPTQAPKVAVSPKPTIAKPNIVCISTRRNEPCMDEARWNEPRRNGRVSALALASAAMIAPGIWMGHAVLGWLKLR